MDVPFGLTFGLWNNTPDGSRTYRNEDCSMSSFIGYARVSTEDQDCAIQEAALRAAGCTVVRSEKKSGTSRDGRTELETVLSFLRAGDTLTVTRIDRLARSLHDLENIVRELKAKGVRSQGDRTAGRYFHASRKSVPTDAWRLCGVRDRPS